MLVPCGCNIHFFLDASTPGPCFNTGMPRNARKSPCASKQGAGRNFPMAYCHLGLLELPELREPDHEKQPGFAGLSCNTPISAVSAAGAALCLCLCPSPHRQVAAAGAAARFTPLCQWLVPAMSVACVCLLLPQRQLRQVSVQIYRNTTPTSGETRWRCRSSSSSSSSDSSRTAFLPFYPVFAHHLRAVVETGV
jgi:hypothetical protein